MSSVASAHRIPSAAPYAGDISAAEAWDMLSAVSDALLVDVRTEPEWIFAGFPDLASISDANNVHSPRLVLLSWKFFPGMQPNAQFLEQLANAAKDRASPLLFLCRTGGRSQEAAMAATAAGHTASFNIRGGFDGPLDDQNRRGSIDGWRAAGLPWRQQ